MLYQQTYPFPTTKWHTLSYYNFLRSLSFLLLSTIVVCVLRKPFVAWLRQRRLLCDVCEILTYPLFLSLVLCVCGVYYYRSWGRGCWRKEGGVVLVVLLCFYIHITPQLVFVWWLCKQHISKKPLFSFILYTTFKIGSRQTEYTVRIAQHNNNKPTIHQARE